MNNLEELREHCEEMMAISPLRYVHIPASSIIGLIAQLEAAQRDRNMHYQVSEKFRIELIATEAELSAANERLKGEQVPMFLKQTGIGVNSCQGSYKEYVTIEESEYEENPTKHLKLFATPQKPVLLNSSTVMSRAYVVQAIKAAGFTVEGESAPVKYIVILQRAWCNDSGSGINYHSDLIEFDKRDKAIKHGFELQDSDDFNIGVLTNGVLTSFDWMAKPLAETKDSLARIASGIGIEGNADAE
ncbi:hypothetical protein [Yersinia mollaretii]|uniref:hypothetical protein n=1 Tax=Yersinia mollaretii TaxID=33060 RepID=UPI0021BDEE52|nr:hypothetical protein [Yersinia mollaretii]